MTCADCSGTYVEKFCKKNQDYCDQNGIAGVSVSVNGVINQCALSGFVNKCADYT